MIKVQRAFLLFLSFMARIDHATAGATCFYEGKEAGMQFKDNDDLLLIILFIFNFKIMITKNDIRKLNNQ